jgi:hypothetical protein
MQIFTGAYPAVPIVKILNLKSIVGCFQVKSKKCVLLRRWTSATTTKYSHCRIKRVFYIHGVIETVWRRDSGASKWRVERMFLFKSSASVVVGVLFVWPLLRDYLWRGREQGAGGWSVTLLSLSRTPSGIASPLVASKRAAKPVFWHASCFHTAWKS